MAVVAQTRHSLTYEQRVEEFLDVILIGGKIERIPHYVTSDVKVHTFTGVPEYGFEAVHHLVTVWLKAFDILDNRCFASVSNANLIIEHWENLAIHKGNFLGVPPNGQEVRFSGMSLYRFRGPKICEISGYTDFLSRTNFD